MSPTSPWLEIPLDDYERHMSLDTVRQAPMLADRFELLVERQRPASLALVGCAGGNGLDRIGPGRVTRVVAVDINPRYVEAAARRYADRFERFERCCRAGGTLATVLQLPSEALVSPSPYRSLDRLSSAMRLIAPAQLSAAAADVGFGAGATEIIESASGKSFCLQTFELSAARARPRPGLRAPSRRS